MKKNRSMIAGLCLLAVMCAGYGAVSFGVEQSEKRKQPEVLPEVKADEVQQVKVSGPEGENVYSRDDGTLTDEMAAGAAGFVLGDCAAWKPGEEELEDLGFDGTDQTISWTWIPQEEEETDEENGQTQETGTEEDSVLAVELEIGRLNDAGTDYYVRQTGSHMIMLMPESSLEQFIQQV